MNLTKKHILLFLGVTFILMNGVVLYTQNQSQFLSDINKNNPEPLSDNNRQMYKSLEIQARKGNDSAMVSIGEYYELGQRVKVDLDKALFWYKKAAEKGNPIGMHNTAMLLFNRKDPEFMSFALRAADNGFIPSQRFLGELYLKKGSKVEQIVGMNWLLKSASKGDAQSSMILAGYTNLFAEPEAPLLWYYIANKQAQTEMERSKLVFLETQIFSKFSDPAMREEIIKTKASTFFNKYLIK